MSDMNEPLVSRENNYRLGAFAGCNMLLQAIKHIPQQKLG